MLDQIDVMFGQLKRMDARRMLQQFINFGMIVASALMIWKSLMIVTQHYSCYPLFFVSLK
jgi:hypothetical protein